MFFSLVKRSDKNPFTFYGDLPKNCETGALRWGRCIKKDALILVELPMAAPTAL